MTACTTRYNPNDITENVKPKTLSTESQSDTNILGIDSSATQG
jgi:hypothetical protein